MVSSSFLDDSTSSAGTQEVQIVWSRRAVGSNERPDGAWVTMHLDETKATAVTRELGCFANALNGATEVQTKPLPISFPECLGGERRGDGPRERKIRSDADKQLRDMTDSAFEQVERLQQENLELHRRLWKQAGDTTNNEMSIGEIRSVRESDDRLPTFGRADDDSRRENSIHAKQNIDARPPNRISSERYEVRPRNSPPATYESFRIRNSASRSHASESPPVFESASRVLANNFGNSRANVPLTSAPRTPGALSNVEVVDVNLEVVRDADDSLERQPVNNNNALSGYNTLSRQGRGLDRFPTFADVGLPGDVEDYEGIQQHSRRSEGGPSEGRQERSEGKTSVHSPSQECNVVNVRRSPDSNVVDDSFGDSDVVRIVDDKDNEVAVEEHVGQIEERVGGWISKSKRFHAEPGVADESWVQTILLPEPTPDPTPQHRVKAPEPASWSQKQATVLQPPVKTPMKSTHPAQEETTASGAPGDLIAPMPSYGLASPTPSSPPRSLTAAQLPDPFPAAPPPGTTNTAANSPLTSRGMYEKLEEERRKIQIERDQERERMRMQEVQAERLHVAAKSVGRGASALEQLRAISPTPSFRTFFSGLIKLFFVNLMRFRFYERFLFFISY